MCMVGNTKTVSLKMNVLGWPRCNTILQVQVVYTNCVAKTITQPLARRITFPMDTDILSIRHDY